jgi:hypothetical protein
MPEGGTYEWSITGDDGAKIAFSKGPDAQVKVDPPAKSFTLHVTYRFDSNRFCTAAKSVTINDVLIVPICLKRLYNSKGKGTKATPEEIAKQLELANEIWKKCCIRFEPERNPDGSTKIEDVNTPKADDGLANSIEVNIVDSKADSPEFRKVLGLTKQDKCIPVWFVKNMTKVQGLTTSPTYPPNGPPTGLDPFGSGVDDHADASTLAHELGHDLGLHHKNDRKNLMTDSGADGRDITPEQCADAYKNAKRLLDALKGP